MLAIDQEKRQQRLNHVIIDLSGTIFPDDEIDECVKKLKNIYEDGFRHNYAAFFPILLDLTKKQTFDFLIHNLNQIKNYLAVNEVDGEGHYSKAAESILKMCDHIELETTRITYDLGKDGQLQTRLQNVVELEKSLEKLDDNIDKVTSKTSNLETEIVGVLSIFSAIIIAFFGGFSFIGNALVAINNAEIYKTVLVVLVCGAVLVNAIFILLYLVSKIMDKSIYAKCVCHDCSECRDQYGNMKCTPRKRVKNRLPFFYYFNLFALIFVMLDIAVWIIV